MFSRPKDYKNLQKWFLYFRMTKSLPHIADKFREELTKTPDVDAAKLILTAYAATALSIIFSTGPHDRLVSEMKDTFKLTPGHMLGLTIKEISDPLQLSYNMEDALKKSGFVIQNGIIIDFEEPETVAKAQIKAPKP